MSLRRRSDWAFRLRWVAAGGFVLILTAMTVGCGGGGDQTNAVTAAATIAPRFPSDFPVYDRATLLSSHGQAVARGKEAFSATWESSDDLSRVQNYYQDALIEVYRQVSTSAVLNSVQFTLADSPKNLSPGLLVLTQISGTNPRVSISAALGVNQTSTLDSLPKNPSVVLPTAVPAPPGFSETGIDLPANGIVIDATMGDGDRGSAYGVVAISPDSPASLVIHYQQSLTAAGFQPTVAGSGQSFTISFENDTWKGAVGLGYSYEYLGYSRVTIYAEHK